MPNLFHMPRVPEAEVMDDASKVEAYTDAVAQAYLEKIDRTFVEHVARLLLRHAADGLRALDVGCGPGQIPIMMAQRWPEIQFSAIDAAPHMIEAAQRGAEQAKVKIEFSVLRVAREGEASLPFPDASFDLVTCNSVVHHLHDPVSAFSQMARVAKPGGAILIRDLRRPSLPTFPLHVRWFGRHYAGEMRRLYEASVRAAYTVPELEEMLQRSRLNDGRSRVFRHGRTHIGIERAVL